MRKAARHAPCSAVMPSVERRLAAADLVPREYDLATGTAEEGLGIGDGFGKDEIAEARREELDAHQALGSHRARV
jgi:hypothetical protein